MRHTLKYLNGENNYLEIDESDETICQNDTQIAFEKNIAISLSVIEKISIFPDVERLIITAGSVTKNISAILKTLPKLRELKLDYDETEGFTEWCVDISSLSSLEFLFSRSSYNFKGISNSKSLKTLIVHNWYGENLEPLKSSSIDTLSINSGQLRNLFGIEYIPLKILSLSYLPNLSDVSSLVKTQLIILEIDKCNKITDIENSLPSTLEYLMFYGNNKVRSVTFINKLKALKRVMLDILISNGDLSPLDFLESAVILTDRRHYNRKNKQLPKSENKFTVSSIPEWRYLYWNRRI